MAICEKCGKELVGKQKKYCSRQCSGVSIGKKKAKGKMVACENCGELVYSSAYAPRRFCSISCSAKFMRKKNKKGKWVKCQTCGKPVFSPDWHLMKYCSRDCYLKAHKNQPKLERTCDRCGKTFKVILSRVNARFCSQKCKLESQKGINHPSHKGGRVLRSFPTKSGYIQKYWILRDERINGRSPEVLEHRFIVEQILGRKLKTNEVVHHINCDSMDNRHENLLVCDRNYHGWLHAEMGRRYSQLFLDTRKPNA